MRGLTWRNCAVALATMSTQALADVTLMPSNTSEYAHEAVSSTVVQLALPDSASSMKGFATVLPLLMSGYTELQPWDLSDPLFHVTPDNRGNLTSAWIAYISCDQSDYPGFTGSSDVFNTALAVNVTAVLLYSTAENYCNVTSYGSSYPYIYTMTDTAHSRELLDKIDQANSSQPLRGLISYDYNVRNDSSSSQGSGQSQGSGNSGLGASPTTAVAMIILYSITGIITALFLVIILTGAIRAHRHPERYGPRNVSGRPRQSRARGVGRAILDTIPIVKFGERLPPKETDVEMAGTASAEAVEPELTHEIVIAGRKSHSDDAATVAEQPRVSTSSARSGIAPAVTHNDEEAPGCSICTEDFAMGEDLRVLPCDHMFHPACIDPWLLNVSGTCPLCRIDLNPARTQEGGVEGTEGEEGADGDLPPPIDGGHASGPRPRIGMRQSFLIGLGLGRVHDSTREERLTAVRRLREQERQWNEERRAANRVAPAVDETSRRRRFRERFGIRTRQRGQEEETREETREEGSGTS